MIKSGTSTYPRHILFMSYNRAGLCPYLNNNSFSLLVALLLLRRLVVQIYAGIHNWELATWCA